jgi:hypothetical protein
MDLSDNDKDQLAMTWEPELLSGGGGEPGSEGLVPDLDNLGSQLRIISDTSYPKYGLTTSRGSYHCSLSFSMLLITAQRSCYLSSMTAIHKFARSLFPT